MVRLIIALCALSALTGCGFFKPTIKDNTQEVKVGILYCPAPPDVRRPTLPIETMPESSPDGEVVKNYKATIAALQGYVKELEAIIEKYDEAAKNSQPIKKFIDDRARELVEETKAQE